MKSFEGHILALTKLIKGCTLQGLVELTPSLSSYMDAP